MRQPENCAWPASSSENPPDGKSHAGRVDALLDSIPIPLMKNLRSAGGKPPLRGVFIEKD